MLEAHTEESLEACIAVIFRDAHYWSFSKRSLSDKLRPSQITEAYSKTGLKKVLFISKSIFS